MENQKNIEDFIAHAENAVKLLNKKAKELGVKYYACAGVVKTDDDMQLIESGVCSDAFVFQTIASVIDEHNENPIFSLMALRQMQDNIIDQKS